MARASVLNNIQNQKWIIQLEKLDGVSFYQINEL